MKICRLIVLVLLLSLICKNGNRIKIENHMIISDVEKASDEIQ